MSNVVTNEATPIKTDSEKMPVQEIEEVKFPHFPDPTDVDFEDDITQEEREFYKLKFPDINDVKAYRLHCTACDRHLGCAARNESRMRSHPMLRTLMCNTCHTFYNSGEFEKGEDGSELYCRWCGQGGQVYCCSDCPHVFCAKCIKRNFGMPKIKEIENTDDWKCFKCDSKCLWDLRALCWALLRFCDLKNKVTYSTQDLKLREAYQRGCAIDDSECCKNKINKRRSREDTKKVSTKGDVSTKVDVENSNKKETTPLSIISKMPPTIQVKKFASINLDDLPKKVQKRPGQAVKNSMTPSNTTTIPPVNAKLYSGVPPVKKLRMTNPTALNVNQMRFPQIPTMTYLPKIRPKAQPFPVPSMMANNPVNGFNSSVNFNNSYNNFNNMLPADNINLSLEELTQGLDMAAVAAMAGSSNAPGNNVVCTPDFPLEPMCEMREDAPDDDVQCLTSPKVSTQQLPPLTPRVGNELPDLAPENIVQMTDNDVTVNPATGGLKFRVDPQTLSSNKMYRLPDGRIFAINANPNMPGGYSATIVAVSDNNKAPKVPPKGATFSARLSAVTSSPGQTKPVKPKAANRPSILKVATKPVKAPNKSSNKPNVRECDLKVPIEWYRFNLIDAVDALEYSLSRLRKLKKEATTTFLRTRTVDEMRSLHKILDRVLNTSSSRFQEVQENLDKGFKTYLAKKASVTENISDDDDDVEILNDVANDDPIFIDENSEDSVADESHPNKTQIDLTGRGSCELNDSSEKPVDQSSGQIDNEQNRAEVNKQDNADSSIIQNSSSEGDQTESSTAQEVNTADDARDTVHELQQGKPEASNLNGDINMIDENNDSHEDRTSTPEKEASDKKQTENNENIDDNILNEVHEEKESDSIESKIAIMDAMEENNGDTDMTDRNPISTEDNNQHNDMTDRDTDLTDDKNQDTDMTEDMIDNLLNDNLGDEIGANLSLLDIPELQET